MRLRPLMTAILLAHLLMLCAGYACSAEEAKLPADAAKLVEAFDADATKLRADAEKAVEKKAAILANALQVVQEKLTKKGDLDGAMAVKTKIAALGVKGDEKIPQEQTVSIDGQKDVGFKLGAVRRGQTFSFQYVSGVWKGWGKVGSENPDAATLEQGDRSRVALVAQGKVIAVIPAGTAARAFTWTAPADLDVTLRMNDSDNDWASNPSGSVTYKVSLK